MRFACPLLLILVIGIADAQSEDAEIEALRRRIAEKDAEIARIQQESRKRVEKVLAERDRLRPRYAPSPPPTPLPAHDADARIIACQRGTLEIWPRRFARLDLPVGGKLEVVDRLPDGRLRTKGWLEITDDGVVLRARVLTALTPNPIGIGDWVRSPLRDPGRTPTMHFLGSFKRLGGRAALTRALTEARVPVAPNAHPDVDILVLGAHAGTPFQACPEWALTRRFGTGTVDAQTLAFCLGLTDRPTPVDRIERPRSVDGHVIARTPNGETAHVDVGETDGLRVGTRFEVIDDRPVDGPTRKGWIVVREVADTSALVAIESESRPIARGDAIANPLFARNAPPRFFVIGRTARASTARIGARITAAGALAHRHMHRKLDFAVIGDVAPITRWHDNSSWLHRAAERGIPRIAAAELERFFPE